MNEVYIVSPYRSAITKAFRGGFRNKRPDELAADVIKGIINKNTQLDLATIEDVYVGCAMPEAEQGMNIGRFIALLAGLPENVPGLTINRFCSSGLQTIAMAADRIQAGNAECILAGGVESMSMIPMMGNKVVAGRVAMENMPDSYLGMGMTAENVAKEFEISRADQDQFALESHQKSLRAIKEGLFADEIIPVTVENRSPGKNAAVEIKKQIVTQDEGPRPDTSLENLAKLKPAFLSMGGTVTAGNSSQMSDGAAFCLVCSESYVKKHNLTPIAKFRSFSVAGVPPRIMGIGPIAAIPLALKKAGISMTQVQHLELNEAFAAQSLAVLRKLDIDPKIVNPLGGAISLGHPLGATGAKLVATLCHQMKKNKQKYGVVSMCIGTGMGAAGVLEIL